LPERPSHFRIYSLITIMTALWSWNYIVAKCGLKQLFFVLGISQTSVSSTKSDGASIAGDALAMLPVVVGYSRGFDFAVVSWVGWASLVYMAVFASVVCYLIYYYALSHVPASRVSAFSYLQPLISTVMAISILDEHRTRSLMSGRALVLTGIFLAERG
jgi:uncharacterized membrane protein